MTISVPELVRVLLEADDKVMEEAQGGVVVGPPSTSEMRKGVLSLAPTGLAKNERDLPLVKVNEGVRCVASTVAKAEYMATLVQEALHEKRRVAVLQPSDGLSYLVHYLTVSGGPSLAMGPTEDFWEVDLTIEVYAGTQAIP